MPSHQGNEGVIIMPSHQNNLRLYIDTPTQDQLWVLIWMFEFISSAKLNPLLVSVIVLLIICKTYLYTRMRALEVSCMRVTNNTLSDSA